MPANTPRGYPYPLYTDLTDFPAQIQDLAEAIDTDFDGLWDRIAAGYNQPAAFVQASGVNQSVANNTDVTATYDTEVYDNQNMVNLGVSTTNINIISTGLYVATARVSWAASASNSRQISIVSSGALGILTRRTIFAQGNVAIGTIVGTTELFWAASGTTVTMVQRQNSGGALNSTTRQLAVARIGSL